MNAYMIYTTYFANLRNLPSDVVPIAICASVPSGFVGCKYSVLAPTYSILMEYKANHNEELYRTRYWNQILKGLNPRTVVKQLYDISCSRDIALVCYEKSSDFCHRHIVAEWLQANGIECREWRRGVVL